MKRFVIALVILFLSLTLSGTGYMMLNKNIDLLHVQVEQVLTLTQTDDREVLQNEVVKLMQIWKKCTELMHMLFMHRAMEEVELHILLLEDQLKNEKLDNFWESCETVKRQLENLKDSEKMSLRNIF